MQNQLVDGEEMKQDQKVEGGSEYYGSEYGSEYESEDDTKDETLATNTELTGLVSEEISK